MKSIQNAKSQGLDNAAKAKVKKLERCWMHRGESGKKFKLFSLKSLVGEV